MEQTQPSLIKGPGVSEDTFLSILVKTAMAAVPLPDFESRVEDAGKLTASDARRLVEQVRAEADRHAADVQVAAKRVLDAGMLEIGEGREAELRQGLVWTSPLLEMVSASLATVLQFTGEQASRKADPADKPDPFASLIAELSGVEDK